MENKRGAELFDKMAQLNDFFMAVVGARRRPLKVEEVLKAALTFLASGALLPSHFAH